MALSDKQKATILRKAAKAVKAGTATPLLNRTASASNANPRPAVTKGLEDLADGMGADLGSASWRTHAQSGGRD